MTLNAAKIELLLAERGWTRMALSNVAAYLGRASAPSFGAAPTIRKMLESWRRDWT